MPGNPVMIVYLRKGAEHPTAVEAGSRADRKMQANPQIYTCQNPDARPKLPKVLVTDQETVGKVDSKKSEKPS